MKTTPRGAYSVRLGPGNGVPGDVPEKNGEATIGVTPFTLVSKVMVSADTAEAPKSNVPIPNAVASANTPTKVGNFFMADTPFVDVCCQMLATDHLVRVLERIQFTPVHILLRRNSFGIPRG